MEVGLVVGRIAATTPTGTPISTILSSGSSRRTPTVFMPRMRRGSQSAAQQILDVLVFGVAVAGLFHRQIGQPLGIGARAAAAMRSTIASTCSWEYVRYFCQAAYAFSTLVRTSWIDRRSLSSSIAARLLLAFRRAGKDLLDLFVRAGNHVDADQFADAPGRGRTGVGGGFHRADIAAHRDT